MNGLLPRKYPFVEIHDLGSERSVESTAAFAGIIKGYMTMCDVYLESPNTMPGKHG
jgi:hypothetical protein